MKMTKKLIIVFLAMCVCISSFSACALAFPETKKEGSFLYYIENGYAVINDYDGSPTGEFVIPEKLGGYQVGAITSFKFQ